MSWRVVSNIHRPYRLYRLQPGGSRVQEKSTLVDQDLDYGLRGAWLGRISNASSTRGPDCGNIQLESQCAHAIQ